MSRLAPFVRCAASRLAPDRLKEDLIQEVWAHLWSENCRVLQPWDQRGPLAHYVVLLASNLIRDRLRSTWWRAHSETSSRLKNRRFCG